MRQVPELLRRIREAEGDDKGHFRQEIKEAVFKPRVAASGAGRTADLVEFRPRLLAYQDLLDFDSSGSLRGLATNVPEAVIQLNELFRFTVRFDVGKLLVRDYVGRWPRARPLTTLMPFLNDISTPRDEFSDVATQDIQIVRKPGAPVTYLLFCGLRHYFGTYLNIIHHACMARLNANVIYVRDFWQNLYLSGIRSIGSAKASCNQLGKHIEALGGRRTVCMGMSGGVFGALYYGSMLRTDFVLLFSGPTSLDIGAEETEKQAFLRVQELHRRGKLDWPDIRETYRENGIPIWISFGKENRVDRLQAENLAELANVRLFPWPSQHHFFMDELQAAGTLNKMIAQAGDLA